MGVKPLTLRDIQAAAAHIDAPDALIRSRTDPALSSALEMYRPPNWHGTGAANDLLVIAQTEGLPLAWVPPAHVIERLQNVSTASDREGVLLSARTDILDACWDSLADCTDPELEEDRELVKLSVSALRDGHDAAGMALSVSVGERLAHWAVQPRVQGFDSKQALKKWRKQWNDRSEYTRIDMVFEPGLSVDKADFNRQVLIAPIPHFFKTFRRGSGKPAPTVLARHVVAHDPTRAHMSRINALKSAMLTTGIVRAQQDWIEEIFEG